MTNSSRTSGSRRGLATSSIVVGAIAVLMLVVFWVIGATGGGDGLNSAVVLAVVLFYASVAVGALAVLLGIAAVIFARPRALGFLGIVLGAVPLIVVGFSPVMQGA